MTGAKSILLALCLALLIAACAQAQTPPTIPCTADLQPVCDAVAGFVARYGGWAFVALALLFVGYWLWRRLSNVAERRTEKVIEKKWEEAGAADEQAAAITRYLRAVIEDYRFVKFRGQGARARGIEPPELDRVYVSLRMTPEAGDELEARSAARHRQQGGKEAVAVQGDFVGRDLRPVNLAKAIRQSSKLAIVGRAGSGKSTLLQWAGLAAARARLADTPATEEQKQFVAAASAGQAPVPIIIYLRDYNRYCSEMKVERNADSLLAFLAAYFQREYPTLKLPMDFFARCLGKDGAGALLMLDGVDEVSTGERRYVREAIEGLLAGVCAANPGNRYLLTSRDYAYQSGAQVAGFQECRVQNLEPDERDRLIHTWYSSVYPGDKGRGRADDLCHSIAVSDQRVKDLAVTPLMVTIFALVHYDGGQLPRHRAALYERAVNILLTESEFKEGEAVKDLAQWGGYSPDQRRNKLARIAFALHDLPDQRGDSILEDDLVELDVVSQAFGSEKVTAREAARAFIQTVADRGGLLEREGPRYGFFTHRTFREFLAGRYYYFDVSHDFDVLRFRRVERRRRRFKVRL
jgi:hypothetical protein